MLRRSGSDVDELGFVSENSLDVAHTRPFPHVLNLHSAQPDSVVAHDDRGVYHHVHDQLPGSGLYVFFSRAFDSNGSLTIGLPIPPAPIGALLCSGNCVAQLLRFITPCLSFAAIVFCRQEYPAQARRRKAGASRVLREARRRSGSPLDPPSSLPSTTGAPLFDTPGN